MAIEEFVNPKSMITPGAAAAVVATVSGAFFSMFSIALPVALLIFSLFVGAIVFYSKEFAEEGMGIASKIFFYALNSLIIFAMATGTHAVLDNRTTSVAWNTTSFVQPAHAQEKATNIPLLKQNRPLFYDWTRGSTDS